MLLRSESNAFNAAVLLVLGVSLILGFLLLSAPAYDELLSTADSRLDRGSRSSVGNTENNEPPAAASGSKGSEGFSRTSVPSGAPIVLPPTTQSPVPQGTIRPRPLPDGKRNFPHHLNLTDPLVANPVDAKGKQLPKCDDPNYPIHEPLGRYRERGFKATVETCLASFEEVDQELYCVGLNDGLFAGSYTKNGGDLCRCGGIPLRKGVCGVASTMTFTYDDSFLEDWKQDAHKLCNETTKWETGTFRDGRYYPPRNCTVLDLNPRSVVSRFPNKLFLLDGDSHQQDKIWGMIAEMRNQRLHAVLSLPNRFGADIRYEVSMYSDILELFPYGQIKFDVDLRRCRSTKSTDEPCTVFVYRFDRYPNDYRKTVKSIMNQPPDFVIAAFLSSTYSHAMDAQMETKAAWADLLNFMKSSGKNISLAWTSFPMNSGFIVQNMTDWVNGLGKFSNVRHHFALLDGPLYASLRNKAGEPGSLTLEAIWHDSCQMMGKQKNNRTWIFGLGAVETCYAPVTKYLYRTILSVFST